MQVLLIETVERLVGMPLTRDKILRLNKLPAQMSNESNLNLWILGRFTGEPTLENH